VVAVAVPELDPIGSDELEGVVERRVARGAHHTSSPGLYDVASGAPDFIGEPVRQPEFAGEIQVLTIYHRRIFDQE
jgi:hypothetical protein